MLVRLSKIAALIIVFMIAAGSGAFLTVHLLIRSDEIVVVPDLIGKEVVYALERLTDLGLNTKVKGSEFSATIPRHHVVSQDPEAGSEIKPGRDVRIVLSKGTRSVILPTLTGLDLTQARLLLEDSGLHLGLLSRMGYEPLPPDTVLAQYPPAGSKGIRDAKVDLLIGTGQPSQWLAMPDLRGMTFDAALRDIELRKLSPGLITEKDDRVTAGEVVIEQTPSPGYPIARAGTIDLIINRLPSTATITGRGQYRILRYRVPSGYLRRSVRVESIQPSGSLNLFDAFVAPGEEIWLLAPRDPAKTILYVDNEPTMVK